jgi:hypothetical protein
MSEMLISETAAVLREVAMTRMKFRVWLRKKLNVEVRAEERERKYFEEFPWIPSLVPIGWNLLPIWTGERLKMDRVRLEVLDDRALAFGNTYIIDTNGKVLTQLRKSGYHRQWETVYEAFKRLSTTAQEKARYVVKVNTGFTEFKSVVITIYKLPKQDVVQSVEAMRKST